MKLKVAILGATGAVGQKFVALLADHPWFEISAVAASERSAGRAYRSAVHWLEDVPLPESVAQMKVELARPSDLDCDFVFSGLDASVAGEIEDEFTRAGYAVVSNAKNHRMQADVPLIIAEVNPDHIALINKQDHGNGGYIVTNPNCATVGLTMTLKPLLDAFGIEAVQVTTLQALSGAGYPGESALDALGNVVPFIGGEEEKVETEPLKLLGSMDTGASFPISAQCTRVPVIDGHLACVSVKFQKSGITQASVLRAFRQFDVPPEVAHLPSSPEKALLVMEHEAAPQPRRHALIGNGMTVSVGRVRNCSIMDIKYVCLVHNTIRGAAGGAILNAELLASRGILKHRND